MRLRRTRRGVVGPLVVRFALYDALPDGGHQTFLAEPIAAALSARGHDVIVLRPEGSLQDPDPRPTRVAML